ncbi:MAG: translation elongation factor Ts [Firmicutes bacterium]|nr:translation elongation factor Ts [Bacillota bacterium]
MITPEDIKRLRERTQAGMLDCKKALEANGGDMDKATTWLREKGMAAAAKKSERIAAEGVVHSYIHMGGKIGVLLEVNCETDFVAKSEGFQTLVRNIGLHIAASKPAVVAIEDVDTTELENEKSILKAQAKNEGKPDAVIEKMVEGRIKKFYKDVCLLEQDYVKNPEITIKQLVNEAILSIGEKITIRRFTRYEMGEGLTKRSNDFAAEVAEQMAGK